ncbi:MAG TPA: DUF4157 domain-containing protein [Thermoanaerobaculia bacterium]|nr:DUF4157 domain-containing protein [Thermoanaerobaculia bacterium]
MLSQRVRRGSSDASERDARRAATVALRHEAVEPLGAAKTEDGQLPAHVRETVRSPGEPLDERLRNALEPRFGHDFSRVRVHTDGQARQSAGELGARAWTSGEHIAFGARRYEPSSHTGQTLIAHELAHVVQQRRSGRPALQLDSELEPFPEDERKKIRVLTAGLSAEGDAIADQYFRAKGSIIPIPADRKIRLGSTMPDELKEGLTRVAAGLTLAAPGAKGPVLAENTSVTIAVRAAGRTVRFSRFRHASGGAAGAEDVVLVEDLGRTEKAPLASPTEIQLPSPLFRGSTLPYVEATKLAECSTNTGDLDRCRRDVLGEKLVPVGPSPGTVLSKERLDIRGTKLTREAGWTWKDWNPIQGVLEALPDSILQEAAGSRWFREAAKVCTPAAVRAGSCDPNRAAEADGITRKVTVFDKAFEATSTRSGTSTELQRKITHEIGHLADARPIRGTADPTKHQTLSGIGVQHGMLGGRRTLLDVPSTTTTGDFQKAAIADGLVTSGGQIVSGALTEYGQTSWKELFSESFALYTTDPDLLRAVRPNVFAYLAARYPRR